MIPFLTLEEYNNGETHCNQMCPAVLLFIKKLYGFILLKFF